jgi:hypothetical protein
MMKGEIWWVSDFGSNVTKDPMIEGAYAYVEGSVINRIMGIVHSHHEGLGCAGVRIKIMERTALRVKWSIENARGVVVGQRVVATIPAEAVHLEAGIFRRGTQRGNRWIGRIVLVEYSPSRTVFTVKIHGEAWTLKAYGPVRGARQPSTVWDVVNVVVDPQRVDLSIVKRNPSCHGVAHVLR